VADGQGREAAAQRAAGERSAGPREEPRGVANPRVVDLIRLDREADAVELSMLEPRGWAGGAAQLGELEAKFNAYLGYVQGGYLARDYPHYAGRRVRFRLECAAPPAGEAARMLAAMRAFAEREGIAFAVEVAAPA
jgi:hypothetical protein